MKSGKFLRSVCALAVVGSMSALPAVAADGLSSEMSQGKKKAKHVILMISDGMGGWHVDATRKYLDAPLAMESLKQHGYMTTFMLNPTADSSTGEYWDVPSEVGTYDPNQGGYTPWEKPEVPSYVDSGATDSAAAASAMFTGRKVCKYTLNAVAKPEGYAVDEPFGVKYYKTIFELAETGGKATGLVTSVNFNHATPASGIVKTQYRKNYGEKARQMIYSDIDVIMGAGHPQFDNNGVRQEADYYGFSHNRGGYYDDYDGEALYNLVRGGFKDRSYIETRQEFEDIASGVVAAPKRIFGLAQVASTLQYNRQDGDETNDKLPIDLGGDQFNSNVPTLTTMTSAALQALEQDEDGFVMMVEAGAVDWAGHGNNLARTLEENVDFDNAVQEVIDWVEEPENGSNWSNTLLIVTADHETGHLQPVGQVSGNEVFDNECWGVGCEGWGGHTNSLIPIYAQGVRSGKLRAKYYGDIVDNTDIYKTMAEAMSGKRFWKK